MRIALAYYGLVRPGDGSAFNADDINAHNQSNVEWCASNMQLLKSCFEGNEIDTYLFSWNCKNSQELGKYFDNVMFMKQISNESAGEILPHRPQAVSTRFVATYGEFLGARQIIRFITNTEIKYDYILFSRPDVRIKLDQGQWLNDYYTCHGGIDANGKKGTGGFLGIGPYDLVKKIFSINLQDIHDIFKHSIHAEDAWTRIIDFSGVEWLPRQEDLYLFQHRNNVINYKPDKY